MNSSPSPSPSGPAHPAPCRRRRFRWGYALATLAGLFLLLVLALALSLLPGGETRAIRQAVLSATPGEWDRQFELGIGRFPVLLAKAALAFAPLEPEVRAGIRSFKGADVAVFHRRSDSRGTSDAGQADLLTQVDTLMIDRGWERVVGVRDGTDTVGIFLPRDLGSLRRTRVCLFVLDGSDLVIVSARLNLEPLVGLVSEHTALLAAR